MRLKHVHRRVSKGRAYFYHRVTGERLPEEPNARAQRVLEINAQLATRAPKPTAAPGTFADLCECYLTSPEYKRLADSTRADYRKRVDQLRRLWAPLPVARLSAEAVIGLRDKFADRPRKADWLVQVLSLMLAQAVKRPSRFGLTHNPAARIGRLWRPSPESNRPWSPAELAAFLTNAPRAVATAVALAYYTGQREGDVLRMRWAAIRDGKVALRQGKTGELVEIPLHPDLVEALGPARPPAEPVVASKRGREITPSGFQTLFQRARKKLGFAAGLTFHGLRHTLAQRLAEAGATESELMAITGHRTSSMVRHYTRRAQNRTLAASAMSRLEPKESKG